MYNLLFTLIKFMVRWFRILKHVTLTVTHQSRCSCKECPTEQQRYFARYIRLFLKSFEIDELSVHL